MIKRILTIVVMLVTLTGCIPETEYDSDKYYHLYTVYRTNNELEQTVCSLKKKDTNYDYEAICEDFVQIQIDSEKYWIQKTEANKLKDGYKLTQKYVNEKVAPYINY